MPILERRSKKALAFSIGLDYYWFMDKKRTKKKRESKLLKFPEIQEVVNKMLWDYIYDNKSSYSQIARITGLSKSRFSELKQKDSAKGFVHQLSESVLEPLIWRDIVQLDKLEDLIDQKDPQKAIWLHLQKYMQDIKRLHAAKYPTEKIDDKFSEMKREAGIE